MVSREQHFVAYNRGAAIEVVELKPGLHLLSNLDVDDFECPKISASYGKFAHLERTRNSSAIRLLSGRRSARCWRIIIRNSIRVVENRMRYAFTSRVMGPGPRV